MTERLRHPLAWYRDPDGGLVDARLHLLDRQMIDPQGVPVSTVNDIEIVGVELGEPVPADAAPTVGAILTGSVLFPRIFGGRMPRSRWHRIDWDTVTDLGIVLTLGTDADRLAVTWVERWFRDRIVARIPGGRHDPQ